MSTQPPMPSLAVLGLFAKRPHAGQVKTRLAAETSAAWSAAVAHAFLLDLVEKFAAVAEKRILVYAPAEETTFFTEVAAGLYQIVAQEKGDLGRRLLRFFQEQMRTGLERVVVLGADSPTLPLAYVVQAFRDLEAADVVLGPATDGGYYLLGCARRIPPIFENIAWSSHRVLAETIARLTDPGWKVALLPPWYDVDTLDDWRMLRGHLTAMRRAGIDPEVPRTERLTPWPPQ